MQDWDCLNGMALAELRPRQSAPWSPDTGVQQVPQAVAQQVEPQHRDEDGRSRQ